MKDRERMIARLRGAIGGLNESLKYYEKEFPEVYDYMLGRMSGYNEILSWYNEIGADGKPVFRK